MGVTGYLNHISSGQLFDQPGGLQYDRLAARQDLRTIGNEINGWEFRGRLFWSRTAACNWNEGIILVLNGKGSIIEATGRDASGAICGDTGEDWMTSRSLAPT